MVFVVALWVLRDMESFDSILHRAVERKGGEAAVEALLPRAKSGDELAALPDRDYLAEMTKCVFRSGFVWKVIENKWPGFEAAFRGFDVAVCAMLSDEDVEQLSADERIVRERRDSFVRQARSSGSFSTALAWWKRISFSRTSSEVVM